MDDQPTCGAMACWWDGEYEGHCELPAQHPGHHWDGLSCYDDDMDEVTGCIEEH